MPQDVEGKEAARMYLQPIAAPSVLGLYGFAGATFMVAAHLAGWYGGPHAGYWLFPFAAFFGGLAQFLAGMWSYKARDSIGTAMHGMWGSFWMAYGILYLLFAVGALAPPPSAAFPELGFWFIVLCWITFAGAAASIGESFGLFLVLFALALGSGSAAIGYLSGARGWLVGAGWCLLVSSWAAWYTATALMLEGTFGRPIIAVGKTKRAKAKPGLAPGIGEPGVMHGQ